MTIRRNIGKSAKMRKTVIDGIKNAKRKSCSESLRPSTNNKKTIKVSFHENKN